MGQTLVITNGETLYAGLKDRIRQSAIDWGVGEDFERLYDWVIIEGFSQVFNNSCRYHIRVEQLWHHDLYRCVYNEVGEHVFLFIQDHVARNKLNFLASSRVKILVTFREIVFVRTYQDF